MVIFSATSPILTELTWLTSPLDAKLTTDMKTGGQAPGHNPAVFYRIFSITRSSLIFDLDWCIQCARVKKHIESSVSLFKGMGFFYGDKFFAVTVLVSAALGALPSGPESVVPNEASRPVPPGRAACASA